MSENDQKDLSQEQAVEEQVTQTQQTEVSEQKPVKEKKSHTVKIGGRECQEGKEDLVFVTSCTYNKTNLLEITNNTRRFVYTIYYRGFITLFFVVGILLWFTTWRYMTFGMLAACAFMVSVYMKKPEEDAIRIYNKNRADFGKDLTVHTDFYQDHLLHSQEGVSGQMRIFYEGINRLVETEHVFILMTAMYMTFTVDKSCFASQEEIDDFRAFISRKCFKTRLKDRTKDKYEYSADKKKRKEQEKAQKNK